MIALTAVGLVLATTHASSGIDSTASAHEATALAPIEEFWSVNGEVNALAVLGNALYLGGDFSQISPRTGPLAAFSREGARSVPFPRVADGSIRVVVGDGRGGWFVGGEFAAIGGVRCRNLVHITGQRRVDRAWCPKPHGEVVALARRGETLFVGGELQSIGGKKRRTLAALGATSGRALDWNPDPGYFVDDIEVHGRTVFALGSFGEIGGKRHGGLAAIDAVTGRVHDWNPRPPIDDHGDPLLRTLAVTDTTVYAGGSILVAYDRLTARRTRWSPQPDGYVAALSISSRRLFVGGSFKRIAGERRSGLASFATSTGALDHWQPVSEPVSALAVEKAVVRAATQSGVYAFHATTAGRLGWSTGAPNAVVRALSSSHETIVVGGAFDGIGGVKRNSLAAIDLRSGRPTSWDPQLGGGSPHDAVYALATNGTTVFVGGLFKSVGGARRNALAAVEASSGRTASFNPTVAGYSVNALALDGSTLYVGGEFTSAGGKSRDGNAAFDVVSGSLLAWYPKVGYLPIVVRDDTVYLGRRSVAAVDAVTGSDVKWQLGLDVFRVPSVDAMAIAEGVVYFGGFFDKANGQAREGLAAADANSGALTTWNPGRSHDEFVKALAVDGRLVYVGSFAGLRAVDASSGATVRSYRALKDERVEAILVLGGRVYAGTEHGLVVLPAVRR